MPNSPLSISRRQAFTGAFAAWTVTGQAQAADTDLFRALDDKIVKGMAEFGIPGVAVGVIHNGTTYARGYGVTDLANPSPVDGDTVFRIASTSKTFTGTSAMRLVDQGRLDLDAPVTRYVPDFESPPGAGPVTIRQLLNHSAGWLGYDYHDTGTDDQALARYANDVRKLPQLTPVGQTVSYNNAAISVAGRVIEAVAGTTYEEAVRDLLFAPLALRRSSFERPATNMAAPHDLDDSGKPASMPDLFYLPRSCNPFGGVLSSVSDQLTYARFFLGDGRTETGTRLLSEAALHGMWSHPGPGGTLMVELTGFGVSWMVRPTAQGINVIQHGGDLSGYHSGFMMVPERNFAITLLTNCETGRKLVPQLFADDWALQRFAGISNLPAEPKSLTPAELAPYEGTYTAQQIPFKGAWVDVSATIKAADGKLRLTLGEGDDATVLTLPFYKPDYVLLDSTGMRANFVRDANGRVEWFRMGGRLLRHTA